MKRFLLLVLSLWAWQLIALTPELTVSPSPYRILQRDSQGMKIQFHLPEYRLSELQAAGKSFQKIELAEAHYLAETGLPELPLFNTYIAIPAQGGISLEVQNSQMSVLSGINPYPVQDASLPETARSFSYSEGFYRGQGQYPANFVSHSAPMLLRELRIVNISISPFVYDAATGELCVRQKIELRVNYTNDASSNELPAEPQFLSAAFAKTYESFILNFEDYRHLLLANTPPRYLIIHGNTTDNTFLNALNAYVLWKRQKGADVDIATTATNSAGSSTSSIQTYIRNRYNNSATRPDYVVLIGDTSGSFTIPCFSNNGGSTDYPYSFMNTGDILGDVFIGRISVENSSQFLVMLNKVFLYEKDINIDTASWLNHHLLVANYYYSGISTIYISKYIKEMALEINPEATFTELYTPNFNENVSSVNNALNQGIGFYSFRGYIDFSPPSDGSISNSYKLPHAVLTTCGTGNYSGTSETETITRMGTTAAPKGSVTAIGMATSSTHTTFNNVLHGGFFEGVFVRGMRTMGEGLLHGKLYMNEIFGVSSPTNVEKFTHWCNLIGDPTMEVFVKVPDSFQIATIPNIPVGLSLLDVAVKNSAGNPVEGASVVLSQGANILSRGYTDAEGNVILVLPASMSAGAAILTIHSHDFKPLQHNIQIQNTATLVPASMVVDDSIEGNNNGIVNGGETVNLYFGLRNTGSSPLNRVGGVLYTESPWVQILQGHVSYPSIPAGGSATPNSPLVISVAPDTPHNTMLRLHLLLDNSMGGIYDVSEFLPVESALAQYISYAVIDNANAVLDPGETARLSISIKNIGAATQQNLFGELISDNDLLEVVDDSAFFGNFGINSTVNCNNDNFQVFCRTPTLPGMLMPLRLRLYTAGGFEQIVPFNLEIGTVSQQHPLGPDSYGYVIYDWTDTAYSEAPVYEWVEIAPNAGGMGTALAINDPYTSTEGDQVGAQSLAVVNLPFAFQFYGRLYDVITVCSNGFIALGETGNAEFRNFRLPGAMGPSPMIAPFWDDLATHSGSSISYWFDRPNRRFIVEWYNMRNGYNGSSPETFQVILYDQNYYYSSLGDGPIKFQYHTFNNVDAQSGNRHGNYSTIGIEDHSGTRGLEYTFNNIYPTAAAPLSSGKALYITNNPSMYDAPATLAPFGDVALRQGETYLIEDLDSYFHSTAYLSYSLIEHPEIVAEVHGKTLRIIPAAEYYGDTQLGIKASDPMGRHIEQYLQLSVENAYCLVQDFESGSLPTGWQIGHLGNTTSGWQIAQNDWDNHFMQCSASPGNTANERLSTASFNLSTFQNTKLRFWMDYQPLGTASSLLQYSFNNITWVNIDAFSSAYRGYREYSLPALDNKSSVRLRWTYSAPANTSGFANHWIIDDLSLSGLVPDTTAPTQVNNVLLVSAANGNIQISWEPSFDLHFSHYEVYLAEGNSVSLSSPMYSVAEYPALGNMETSALSISGLPEAIYTLAIRALDLSGNASELSDALTFSLGIFTIAPQNISLQMQAQNLILSWDAVNSDLLGNPISISGYKVYASDTPYFELNAESFIGSTATNSFSIPTANQNRRFFKVTVNP
ncbi:MAG: C25 family cysteine peptidase [Candidatus Cloacimonetes bacterium]|nr:C25 family cysteine peptidase [Candidatus Cloacimonadota bacterium]